MFCSIIGDYRIGDPKYVVFLWDIFQALERPPSCHSVNAEVVFGAGMSQIVSKVVRKSNAISRFQMTDRFLT